jgi:hypothetical protein
MTLKNTLFIALIFFSLQGKCQTTTASTEIRGAVFLNLKIESSSLGKPEISINSINNVAYKCKQGLAKSEPAENQLMFLIKNNRNEVLARELFPNPLHQTLEAPNENGQIQSVEIQNQKSDFSVELPDFVSAKNVEVYVIDNQKKSELISSFRIR